MDASDDGMGGETVDPTSRSSCRRLARITTHLAAAAIAARDQVSLTSLSLLLRLSPHTHSLCRYIVRWSAPFCRTYAGTLADTAARDQFTNTGPSGLAFFRAAP